MDYIREQLNKGKLKLFENLCECGEHFWTKKGGVFDCPYCGSGDTCLNSCVNINFECLNDEEVQEKKERLQQGEEAS